MKSIFIMLFCVLAGVYPACAQDPTFSQYFNNKQYVNPAYAGTENGARASLNYRNQWHSLAGKFNTFTFAADMGIRPVQGGIGLLVLSDRVGKNTFNTDAVYLNLQKLIRIVSQHNRLCVAYFGVQSGFVQRRYDWSNLVFSDQLDPVFGVVQGSSAVAPEQSQKNYPDMGGGGLIRYKTNKHYSEFGLAVTHLNRPNQSYYGGDAKLPMKWTVHYLAQLPIRAIGLDREPNTFLAPSFLFEKQGYSEQLNLTLKLHRDFFYGGLGYRFKRLNVIGQKVDAAVAHIGFSGLFGEGQYAWQLGYSYDFTVSAVRAGTTGSHELSLLIEFDKLRLGKHGLYTKTRNCAQFDSRVKNLPVF